MMPYMSFVERRGQARGVALVLLGLLEQHFGPLSAQTLERLDQAEPERLMAWSLRVLDARSLDEVFAEDPG